MKWCFLILFLFLVYWIFITLSRDHFSFVKYIGQWSPRFQTRYVREKTLYDICQNKYESYLFLTKLGIPVPRLYYYGFLHKVDFDKLPPSFVIKTVKGFGSHTVFPFKKGVNQFDKTVGLDDVLEKVRGRLCLVEEFLKNTEGEYSIPNDYKVFCFDGVPEVILLKRYKNSSYRKKSYTATDWKPLKDLWTASTTDTVVPKPAELDEILQLSRKLGAYFRNNVVRLDFYITDRGVIFGEFTPHPSGGMGYSPFGKRYLNKLMKKHKLSL